MHREEHRAQRWLDRHVACLLGLGDRGIGRRGGKSSTLCPFGVLEARYRLAMPRVGDGIVCALLIAACSSNSSNSRGPGLVFTTVGPLPPEETIPPDASKDATGDAVGDSSKGCGAASPIIRASDYDQSCTKDTDCVEISQGPTCNPCYFSCSNAAINVRSMAQYNADTANLYPAA
jgi:hypothetical protein